MTAPPTCLGFASIGFSDGEACPCIGVGVAGRSLAGHTQGYRCPHAMHPGRGKGGRHLNRSAYGRITQSAENPWSLLNRRQPGGDCGPHETIPAERQSRDSGKHAATKHSGTGHLPRTLSIMCPFLDKGQQSEKEHHRERKSGIWAHGRSHRRTGFIRPLN